MTAPRFRKCLRYLGSRRGYERFHGLLEFDCQLFGFTKAVGPDPEGPSCPVESPGPADRTLIVQPLVFHAVHTNVRLRPVGCICGSIEYATDREGRDVINSVPRNPACGREVQRHFHTVFLASEPIKIVARPPAGRRKTGRDIATLS